MSRRYKEARLYKKLTVAEAIKKLRISQPTLSAWEGERKSPSIDALENMADLYGVTTDYLLGRADSFAQEPTNKISQELLYILNGKPVWSPTYGWMLVHASDRRLLCADGSCFPFSDAGELFLEPFVFPEPVGISEAPIRKADLQNHSEVWVEPISSDPELRQELRGWYQLKDRYAENEFGSRFYLDRYAATWLAFSCSNDENII